MDPFAEDEDHANLIRYSYLVEHKREARDMTTCSEWMMPA